MMDRARVGPHHYQSDKGEIFSYSSKMKNKTNQLSQLTFYCNNSRTKCHARCVVVVNDEHFSVKLNGVHSHEKGLKKVKFYRLYQFLSKENWKHIQIFKDKDVVIVIRLC